MTIQDHSDFVSVAEAARILGISKSTIKRRIAAGTVEAEQLQRAQGLEYRVRVQRDVPESSHDRSNLEQAAPSTGTTQDVPSAIAAAVAPLVERLGLQDVVIERQGREIAELREDRGRLTAERDAAEARYGAILAAQSAPASSEAPTARWRGGWSLVLALVAVVLLLYVVLLVWPR